MTNSNDSNTSGGGDNKDYERWLETHGVGTVQANLKDRLNISVKLYMDDVRPCPIGWTVARSVKEAIAVMETYVVTEASLDHDLGACHRCLETDPNAAVGLHCAHVPDGMAFVRWMVSTGCWPTKRPTVHSMNPSGKLSMQTLIERHWTPSK